MSTAQGRVLAETVRLPRWFQFCWNGAASVGFALLGAWWASAPMSAHARLVTGVVIVMGELYVVGGVLVLVARPTSRPAVRARLRGLGESPLRPVRSRELPLDASPLRTTPGRRAPGRPRDFRGGIRV